MSRLARRVPLGMARVGATSLNSSGDFAIAFSTARQTSAGATPERAAAFVENRRLDPLLGAVVEATEEAIINSLLAADTMTGRDSNILLASRTLLHGRLHAALGLQD